MNNLINVVVVLCCIGVVIAVTALIIAVILWGVFKISNKIAALTPARRGPGKRTWTPPAETDDAGNEIERQW